MSRSRILWILIATFAGPAALAADWNNAGGNAGRNGLTTEIGPDSLSDLLWAGGRSSIIAWQPVIEGGRVFMVRQTGFPPEPNSDESPVVAMNLDTGQELWFRHIPAAASDWTTWIAGARDGRVYAARSGNGSSVSAVMYALDAATGATVWTSQDVTSAGAYDGVVFAANGDLLVADFRNITRIRATDGTTAFRVDRLASVSGSCGGCLNESAAGGPAFYVADAAPGGTVIKRFDAETGALEYTSPVMAGFTIQNTPMVAPDGTVYLSRTQNNTAVDFFYAINDDGAAMTIRWSVPARWSVVSEFAVNPAGDVFMMAPGDFIQLRSRVDGALLAETESPIASDFNAQPRMACDDLGRLYLSNGSFSLGRFYSFNADLTERWSLPVANINIGAPAIGRDGTLVICGVGTNVRAYRTPRVDCPGDLDGDQAVALTDLAILLSNFGTPSGAGAGDGDLDGDGDVDLSDLSLLLSLFGTTC
ncbi:MAG: PQQ-like beta-propeller repeat protein [Phycisphaerales bacterium]|nr:PQQ-like beta-propeller repeat protein [Phycisphaerales bacterium]